MAARDGADPGTRHSAGMPTPERSSGTGLLVLMSGATVLATAVISVSLAAESWLLLPVALGSVALGAVAVLLGIARSLSDDGEDGPPARMG